MSPMSNRIPSSLKWLTTTRSKLHGQILKIEKDLSKTISITEERLSSLRKQLNSIDETIKLHEIKIDPKKIPSVQTYKVRTGFKYGEITRLIYRVLGDAGPLGATTREIVYLLITLKGFEINSEEEFKDIYDRVRYRLKSLSECGKIRKTKHGFKARWYSP